MSTLNIMGIVLLGIVMILGIIIKLYTKKKLNEMDGMGVIHQQDTEKENSIYL